MFSYPGAVLDKTAPDFSFLEKGEGDMVYYT